MFDTTAHVRRLDFMSDGRIGALSGDKDICAVLNVRDVRTLLKEDHRPAPHLETQPPEYYI